MRANFFLKLNQNKVKLRREMNSYICMGSILLHVWGKNFQTILYVVPFVSGGTNINLNLSNYPHPHFVFLEKQKYFFKS